MNKILTVASIVFIGDARSIRLPIGLTGKTMVYFLMNTYEMYINSLSVSLSLLVDLCVSALAGFLLFTMYDQSKMLYPDGACRKE